MIQVLSVKSNFIKKTLFISFVFCLLFVNLKQVEASVYVFEKGGNNYYTSPQEISNPEKVQYLYGILSPGEALVDYYKFTLPQSTANFSIELMLSEKEANLQFEPTLVFIDPTSFQAIGDAPIGFPSGQRGRAFHWETGKTESNILGKLISGVNIEKNMSAGTYFLAVYDPQSHGGRYVIKLGAVANSENIMDKLMSIINMLRIKLLLY